jgi:UDP-N-acetylglucosamine transferase subunit ALG13
MSTFVAVGNLRVPFERMLLGVDAVAAVLPQPIVVQCGHTLFASPRCQVVSFLEMGAFQREVARADLLILQAGAGSIIQAIEAGKVPIVVPRRAHLGEHIDDHQFELARALADEGRVVAVEDVARLSEAAALTLALQLQIAAAGPSPMVALVAEALARHAQARS